MFRSSTAKVNLLKIRPAHNGGNLIGNLRKLLLAVTGGTFKEVNELSSLRVNSETLIGVQW